MLAVWLSSRPGEIDSSDPCPLAIPLVRGGHFFDELPLRHSGLARGPHYISALEEPSLRSFLCGVVEMHGSPETPDRLEAVAAKIPVFCRFERSYDLHLIEVNVSRICYVEGNDGDTSTIYFDKEHFVVVRGSAEQIRTQIEFEIFQSQIVPPRRGLD
ncbi:hypothetical protein AB4037_32075 [Labrys sp. KB_33_2]|uniref:hypothetical protein n=1 Tax=Labrys sp. KB_33_2 TaxID=3237479 RepID=UPI003F8E375C